MDSYDVLISIDGPDAAKRDFWQHHIAAQPWSLNSFVPMPHELDYELNNFVTDGYDALFGDWRALAGYWMFKEAAAQRDYPFPLEAREQVLACIAALGEFGERRLMLGQRFHDNLQRFGHGHALTWQKQHWGIEGDADGLVAHCGPSLMLSLTTYGVPSPKFLGVISKPHPQLAMRVDAQTQEGRRGKSLLMKAGKIIERFEADDQQIKTRIAAFRSAATIGWLRASTALGECDGYLSVCENGIAWLKDTEIAVGFAMARLRSGEPFEELASRFPQLTPDHGRALAGLMAPGVPQYQA